jgi:hypothetical protein
MSHLLKVIAVAAMFAAGATLAGAQTTNKDSPSKAEKGAPDQGPGKQTAPSGVGSSPIGPPATSSDLNSKNPTGMSSEKKKSESNDPGEGGKKQ